MAFFDENGSYDWVYCLYLYMYILSDFSEEWYENMTEVDDYLMDLGVYSLRLSLDAGFAKIIEFEGKDDERVIFYKECLICALALSTDAVIDCVNNGIITINDYVKSKHVLDIWTQLEIDERLRKNDELMQSVKCGSV